MQQFQRLLKKALQENVLAIDLSAEHPPRFTTASGDVDLIELGILNASYIQQLMTTLFPNLDPKKPNQGQINIPNYGQLISLAIPDPVNSIKIFLPQGQSLFNQALRDAHESLMAAQSESFDDDPFSSPLFEPPAAQPDAPSPATSKAQMEAPLPPPPPTPGATDSVNQQNQDHALNHNTPTDEGMIDGLPEQAFLTAPPPKPATEPQNTANASQQPNAPQTPQTQESKLPADDLEMAIFGPPPATPPTPQGSDNPASLTPPPVDNPQAQPMPDALVPDDLDMAIAIDHQIPVSTPVTENPSLSAEKPTPEPLTPESKPHLGITPDLASAQIPAPQLEIPHHDNTQPDQGLSLDKSPNTAPAPAPEQIPATSQQPHQTSPAPAMAHPLTPPAASVEPPKRSTTIEPGPKEIDKILNIMLEKKASDIHFTSGEPVALRIDGDIVRLPEWVLSEEQIKNLFWPITSEQNQYEFETTSDTDFAYEIPNIARFRVNLFCDRHGMGAVLRHIPSNILTFKQLGLPEVIKKFCYLSKGLVVVTGPTGSGKSTTLAAIIDHINDIRKDHILTLEDPIEFVHPQKQCLIRQREIHKHTESFARALRAALREDPDIILVGELRDLETTAMAIEIAETGHLVFGTLHTTTAISTIDRIIDQFSSDQQEQIRTMLAESLKGVVAQTLLKKIGGGRCAAQEILIVDNAISSMIREGKTHMIANHMQSQKQAGNILLNDALTQLVASGKVEPREAWMKAVDKTGLIERFKLANIDISWYTQPQNTGNKKAS